MQPVHKIVPTKSSKIAIRENLDPRKFNAIWYAFCIVIGALKFEIGFVPSDKNVTHNIRYTYVKVWANN